MPGHQLVSILEERVDLTPALFLRNVKFNTAATDDERDWFEKALARLHLPTLLAFITELSGLNCDGSLPECADKSKHILVKFDDDAHPQGDDLRVSAQPAARQELRAPRRGAPDLLCAPKLQRPVIREAGARARRYCDVRGANETCVLMLSAI